MFRNQFNSLRGVTLVAVFILAAPLLYSQSSINVKFSVDLSLLISQNKFSPAADRVLIKGTFNSWGDQNQLNREGTTSVYSGTISLSSNQHFEYKFYISTSGADNGGLEKSPGIWANGNRTLNTGTSAIILPVVAYNNADLELNLTTDHFNFYCTNADISTLTNLSTKLETDYSRVITALQATIDQKINVYIYKDLAAYHNAIGYPEFPDWAVGSAAGKTSIHMTSPNHPGSSTYSGMMQIVVHEFVHIAEAWKTTTQLPVWLNEGVATYFGGQVPTRAAVRNLLTGFGNTPSLSLFENTNTFGNIGGYEMAYTIAEFIIKTHGTDKLAQFVQNVSYSVLGYASKTAFQTGWHTFLSNYYINTPPPSVSIGGIRRFGESWFITYSPHNEKDIDNNTLVYQFTITSDGFTKTYTDNNHTGALSIPKTEFENNTTYTVSSRSYDGIIYTESSQTRSFSTANNLPTLFTFSSPVNEQVVSFNSDKKIMVTWTPTESLDSEGDPVTDKITIEGKGLNRVFTLPGGTGFLLLDSTALQPGTMYTLHGERSDGYDVVEAASLTFFTPGTNGMEATTCTFNLICYPVPAHDFLTVEAYFTHAATLNIGIYSIHGQQMFDSQHNVSGSFSNKLDISAIPPGVYFVDLLIKENTGDLVHKTLKFIRE
jgi:hypothetical protein